MTKRLPPHFAQIAKGMPLDEVVERVARAIFRVGKDAGRERDDSEDRNWRECVEEAEAAIAALSD